MRIYLCIRADDKRTWPWRYGVVNEVSGYVVIAKGARPRALRRVAAEVKGLSLSKELWFWLGGASDCVIDGVLRRFGGVTCLADFLRCLGFNGVLGPDYTVYWDDASLGNRRRFIRYLSVLEELIGVEGLRVVPQVKASGLADLRKVLSMLDEAGGSEVMYNASFDLRDYAYGRVKRVLSVISGLGLTLWLGIPGWLHDLGLTTRFNPRKLVMWRHLTRLAYPSRRPGEELVRLMSDLRRYGYIECLHGP